jgi:hypothetical protein
MPKLSEIASRRERHGRARGLPIGGFSALGVGALAVSARADAVDHRSAPTGGDTAVLIAATQLQPTTIWTSTLAW